MKRVVLQAALSLAVVGIPITSVAQDVMYKCPGATPNSPPLYTNSVTAKEARDRGCKTLEGAPVTVIQNGPRTGNTKPNAVASNTASRPENRVNPVAQKERDADARRILQGELEKEQAKLAALQKEYNNGQPERQGGEHNYQKYLDRTAELKASVERSENDVAALKRELSKLQ